MTELKDDNDEFEDIEDEEGIMRIGQNEEQQIRTGQKQQNKPDIVDLTITLQ